MFSSDTKSYGDIRVRSRYGPIRIELLDDRLNRCALGFGELQANVPAGLYTLQYTASTVEEEEIVRVTPGAVVLREIDLRFPAVTPLSVSTTTHEFHTYPAQAFSEHPRRDYGVGGGLMIFVRTIDGTGRAPVPADRLSICDSNLRHIADLATDGERNDGEGWACLSARVAPGGYALRWRRSVGQSDSTRGGSIKPVDQSLWVSSNWTTMVFIGYRSESNQLEQQSASIHMVRLGLPFQPGPALWEIRQNSVPEWDLKEAQVNQALDLALSGLRTGNQVVPDNLLDLLLHAKYQNPMLGIVGAHAMIQRRSRNWNTFDVVVQNLESLVPGHPDVAALRFCGNLLRNQDVPVQAMPIDWPPMLSVGYRALIESDWNTSGHLIADESVAERAATTLLPESPWTYWVSLDEPEMQRSTPMATQEVSDYIQQAVRESGSIKAIGNEFGGSSEMFDLAVRRVSRHIRRLREMGDEVDVSTLSLDDFGQLGLPVATVEKAIQTLKNSL